MLKWISILLLIGLVGGFAYVTMTDVPVSQTEVSISIPNDRFYK